MSSQTTDTNTCEVKIHCSWNEVFQVISARGGASRKKKAEINTLLKIRSKGYLKRGGKSYNHIVLHPTGTPF